MIRLLCLTALALPASAVAGGAGDVDFGLYTGLVFPGPNHELYEATVAPFRKLSVGPALGGRVGYRPLKVFAAEGEAHAAFAGTDGGSSALLYAFRAQGLGILPVELPADFEPFLVAGLGDIGVSSSADEAVGRDLDVAAHLGLGGRVPISDRIAIRADLRYLFSAKHEVVKSPGGHTEFLVGLNYRIPGQADADGDGIVDNADACPHELETVNDYKDDDGCPDELATVNVDVVDQEGLPVEDIVVMVDGREVGRTDATGRAVLTGLMPETQVQVQGTHFHMNDSEAMPVELASGGNGTKLQMTWLPGRVRVVTKDQRGSAISGATASFVGPREIPPGPVKGGDSVFYLAPGAWTVLVAADTFGTERRELEIGPDQLSMVVVEVELEPAKVEVTYEEVKILEKVLFQTNSAELDESSTGLLDEVANTLLANPRIHKVEVQGHSDSVGSDSANLKLSQARMESVVRFLVSKGVGAERLVAKGYGESKPIADNKTEAGRAQNRRVQFVILEQGE